MLLGPFLSDQPELKSRWGDASPLQFNYWVHVFLNETIVGCLLLTPTKYLTFPKSIPTQCKVPYVKNVVPSHSYLLKRPYPSFSGSFLLNQRKLSRRILRTTRGSVTWRSSGRYYGRLYKLTVLTGPNYHTKFAFCLQINCLLEYFSFTAKQLDCLE